MALTSQRRQAWAPILLLAILTPALAHQGATGVVKERMDVMGHMGAEVKTLAAMIQGSKPYDKETAEAAAELIRDRSGETLTALFPEGSLNPPSKTAETVWTDWERFSAMADELSNKAERLRAIAASGGNEAVPDGLRVAFIELNQACASCHRDFRLPD